MLDNLMLKGKRVEHELDILDPSYQAKWTVNWHLHTNSKRRET